MSEEIDMPHAKNAVLKSMTEEQVRGLVVEFEQAWKDYRKVRLVPGTCILASRADMDDAQKAAIDRWAQVRDTVISIFNIKGQNYQGGRGLDAHQIVERKFTLESALRVWNHNR